MEKRLVHPWKLVYKGQAWYLQGWCTSRKAERFFKLSRMRNISMTGKIANITKATSDEFKIKSKSSDMTADKQFLDSEKTFQKHTPLLTIKAKVLPEKIPYLLDTFICSEIVPHKDASITATFTLPEQDWIYDMLFSFSSNMKIISPKSVREKILHLAKEVQKLYEK